MNGFRFQRAAILLLFGWVATALPAQPTPPGDPAPVMSRIVTDGDLEIVTFESEAGFAELAAGAARDASRPLNPGALDKRYFRSGLDGSVQPLALWVPPNYDARKRYPLVVQLHGIGPKTLAGRRQEWPGLESGWLDAHVPAVVVQAYGRGNTFYQGIGEQDVLEAIAEARRLCSIDDRRIYLMGHSMGGAGVFTVGLRQPDRFGGITVIDGAMGAGGITGSSAGYPSWLEPQTHLYFPTNLFPNARNLPVFFKGAGAGIQKTSTEFTDGIVAEGGFSTTENFPGMPHHFVGRWAYGTFLSQLIHAPIAKKPAQVKFITNTLAHHRAYWVTLDQLERHNAPAKITATYDDGRPPPLGPGAEARRQRAIAAGEITPENRPPSFTVSTDNIAALTLRISHSGVPADATFPLVIDGHEFPAPLPAVLHLKRVAGTWQQVPAPALGGKRHGRQGPIGDAFNARFLAVYGEGDRDLAIAELDALRHPRGRLVMHADLPMKSAATLTEADIASSNLLLFGTPATNPVLARLAPRLPASLMQALSAGTGVIFIYPHPESAGRYVVVWSTALLSRPNNGLRPGFLLPVNQLPDFVLVRDGRISAGGYFDNDWNLTALPAEP